MNTCSIEKITEIMNLSEHKNKYYYYNEYVSDMRCVKYVQSNNWHDAKQLNSLCEPYTLDS